MTSRPRYRLCIMFVYIVLAVACVRCITCRHLRQHFICVLAQCTSLRVSRSQVTRDFSSSIKPVLTSLIIEARRTSTCIRILLRFLQSLDIQQYPSRHVTCWKLYIFLRHVFVSISARSRSSTRWTRATSTSASPSPPPSSARWPSSTLSSERQRGASEPERYACT